MNHRSMRGRWWARWACVIVSVLAFAPCPAVSSSERANKTEIIVSIIGGSETSGRAEGFRALSAAYAKYHPGVRITVEPKGNSNGVGYSMWLNTQLSSGSPRPDIVSGNYSIDYTRYLNLDYYHGQLNPYTGRTWSRDLDFNFFKSTNRRGERTMVATQMTKVMWYYNQDIFDGMGLKPPTTWNEFMETCAKLQNHGVVPLSLRFNYRFYQWILEILTDQYTRPYIDLIRARPGDWCYDPKRDGEWVYNPADPFNDTVPTINYARLLAAIRNGAIRYDTEAFVAALENLKSIAQFTPADFMVDTSSADAEAYTLFLNGVAAIHLDTTRLMSQLDRDLTGSSRFRWGTFDTPPQVNLLVHGPIRSVESAAGEYVSIIHKNQLQTDRVLDFVQFWLSPAGYQIYVNGQVASGNFQPSGLVMVRDVVLPRRFESSFGRVRRKGNAETALNAIYTFPSAGSEGVNDIKQTLGSLVSGRIDAQTAASQIQNIMVRAVDEIITRNRLGDSFLAHPEIDPNA